MATLKRTPDEHPHLVVFGGKLHCFFNQIEPTGERTLLWFSRPLLSFDLWSWMSHHHDRTPLSSLTIPGSHDYQITTHLPLSQQLVFGIRFFDFRLKFGAKELFCTIPSSSHMLGPLTFSFSAMMARVFRFLRDEPSETVLISISQDSSQAWVSPLMFCRTVAAEIHAMTAASNGRSRWYTLSDIPDLGTVRSCAVLLRRFPLPGYIYGSPPPLGVDFSNWEDSALASYDNCWTDPSHTDKVFVLGKSIIHTGVALDTVIRKHSRKVVDHMLRSSRKEARTWSVAFCSTNCHPEALRLERLSALDVAVGAHSMLSNKWVDGVNVVLARFLRNMSSSGWDRRTGQKSGFGIVLMDYPDRVESSDAVATLIEMGLPHRFRRSPGPVGAGRPGAGGFGLFETYRTDKEKVGTPTDAERGADDTGTEKESVLPPPPGTKRKADDISKTPPMEHAALPLHPSRKG